eukprot:SAG11_NODE_33090_length_279_cov_0.577778_1_plen_46_part_10
MTAPTFSKHKHLLLAGLPRPPLRPLGLAPQPGVGRRRSHPSAEHLD